jgi:S1-C subfamily serine protease
MTTVAHESVIARRRPALRKIALGAALTTILATGCGTSYVSPAAPATPATVAPSARPAVAPKTAPPAPVDPAAANTALALQSGLVDVVRTVGPSVVVIETDQGLGSGVIYDSAGDIVTNAHVTEGKTSFTVTMPDGRQLPGSLVGSFPTDDLAVVHVDATGLSPATFGDSSKLVVGDIVLAVGNPLGLQSSVTEGLVSALGRTLSESDSVTLPNLIQTSAPINPGNSGGALANLRSEVVGIPTLSAEDPQMGGAAVGIGFAIPSNTVTDIASQLIRYGKVVDSHRTYLGVEVTDVSGADGVLVRSVAGGGPAANAGIKRGDLIASIDGHATPSTEAFSEVLATLSPDQTVPVDIAQLDGNHATVNVTLGELAG